MILKAVTMASLVHRASFALALTFLLRTSVAAEMENSNPTMLNGTTVSLVFGHSQHGGNTSDEDAATVRESKARKVNSYQNLTITTSTERPVTLAIHLVPTNESDSRVMVKTTSSPRIMTTAKYRRSTPHRKYTNNHHHSVSHQTESEEKRKIYVTNEDYSEQQHQNYQPDYYIPQTQEYEDPYITIPVEQSYGGLDGVIPDYQQYVPQDPGYFGPPIPNKPHHNPPHQSPPHQSPPHRIPPPRDVHQRGCRCPEPEYKECNNTSEQFLKLAGSLGSNMWDMTSLIATSSLPFLIPMLILKLILVPIGIVKFLGLIKMFFKLFIILPFLVRHIYPVITENFNLHDLLFQKIQDVAEHVHNIPHPHDDDIVARNSLNVSSVFRPEFFDLADNNTTSIWDLRGCPSRVACELGSFLSSSSYVNFPQKLTNYLSKRADRVEARSRSDETSENNDVEYEDEEEEQDRMQQRDEAFKAFVVALGKNWTQEECVVYACSVLI